MQFEWDEAKDRANRAKHGIGFDRAVRVFEGDYVTALARPGPDGEVRYNTIGVLDEVLIVSVIHTDRHGVTRIISARPAKRKERKFYDGQNRKGQT
ncbi:BrnT family toxin [Hyphomonadaceae bacterium BL14]|nr:BrnT family toxin [Hyphomonadaceae bacterium BL14]